VKKEAYYLSSDTAVKKYSSEKEKRNPRKGAESGRRVELDGVDNPIMQRNMGVTGRKGRSSIQVAELRSRG